MNVCFGSFYLSFFIYVLLRNLLFYLALKYTTGKIEGVLFITTMVDIVFIMFFPIMFLMFGGVC